jgi:hypothetical protein
MDGLMKDDDDKSDNDDANVCICFLLAFIAPPSSKDDSVGGVTMQNEIWQINSNKWKSEILNKLWLSMAKMKKNDKQNMYPK